jgi:hypothetical protein
VLRCQAGGFVFQLGTPLHQDFILACFCWHVVRFINDLLDGWFPFDKAHRQFPCRSGSPVKSESFSALS